MRDKTAEQALEKILRDGLDELERRAADLQARHDGLGDVVDATRAKLEALRDLFGEVPEFLHHCDVIHVGEATVGEWERPTTVWTQGNGPFPHVALQVAFQRSETLPQGRYKLVLVAQHVDGSDPPPEERDS